MFVVFFSTYEIKIAVVRCAATRWKHMKSIARKSVSRTR